MKEREKVGCSRPSSSRNGDGTCTNRSFTRWGRLKDVRKNFTRCGRIKMEEIYGIFALGRLASFDRKNSHFLHMCMCGSMCTHECSAYGGHKRVLAGAGVSWHCELLDLGAGNRTGVLCKSIMCFKLLSHLLCLVYFNCLWTPMQEIKFTSHIGLLSPGSYQNMPKCSLSLCLLLWKTIYFLGT